jgi:hypothetical protein
VEFYGQHANHDSSVVQLVFLPNEVSHNWTNQEDREFCVCNGAQKSFF